MAGLRRTGAVPRPGRMTAFVSGQRRGTAGSLPLPAGQAGPWVQVTDMLNLFRIYRTYRDYRNRIPGDSRYTFSMDRRRWDRRVAFIMAAIVGLGAAGLAALWWMASADARALEKGAVRTMAEVVDLEAEQSNGKTRYIARSALPMRPERRTRCGWWCRGNSSPG